MSKNDEIPLCPIAGWSVGPVKAYEAVAFKLDFLTNPLQKLSEANTTPHFLVTTAQALELAEALQKAVQKVQSAEFQAAPGPKH
jgi:hypothetical protein